MSFRDKWGSQNPKAGSQLVGVGVVDTGSTGRETVFQTPAFSSMMVVVLSTTVRQNHPSGHQTLALFITRGHSDYGLRLGIRLAHLPRRHLVLSFLLFLILETLGKSMKSCPPGCFIRNPFHLFSSFCLSLFFTLLVESFVNRVSFIARPPLTHFCLVSSKNNVFQEQTTIVK